MGHERMKLAKAQSYALLAKHGCYISEICDKCGRGLGSVRFTRDGEFSAWCSRECRGEFERPAMLKSGRPRKYKNAADRRAAKTKQQRNYRSGPRVEKTVCMAAETKDLQAQESPLSRYPLSPVLPSLEMPRSAKVGDARA
jgi:hypothetical protein